MIKIDSLRLEYRDGRRALPVLEDLSLEVREGESIAILGPSGCGKTSLLYTVCGLVQPSGGRVIVDGEAVKRPRRDVALILQDLGLLPWKTVWKNASLSLELGGPMATTDQTKATGEMAHEWRKRKKSVIIAYLLLIFTGVWAAGQRFYLDRPFSAAIYLIALALWVLDAGFFWSEVQKVLEADPQAHWSAFLWGRGWEQTVRFVVLVPLSLGLLGRLVYDLFTLPQQVHAANLLIKEQVLCVKPILDKLGLAGLYDRFPMQLSGGERQRVALARALATQPKVLLMDEPLAALDAFNRERIQDLLLQLWKERNLTQVFVTHDVEEAVYLGSRIVVLSERPAQVEAIIENPYVGMSRTSPEFYEKVLQLRRELA